MGNNLNECKNLNELFDKWREAHKSEEDFERTTIDGIPQASFEEDGYICIDEYMKAPVKVLFILKEANIKDYSKDLEFDKRSQVGFYSNYIEKDEGLNRPKQQEKIGRMAHYLINEMTEESKKPQKKALKASLKMSACININKRGGGKNTNNFKFAAYIEEYKKYIKREIEIINPDYIVVIGKSYANGFLKNVAKAEGKKIIEMWHTAYRMSRRKRNENPVYTYADNPDKNVDCYMREFFDRCSALTEM